MKERLGFEIIREPSLKNRALNYGDGCFTTMLCRKGKVELLDLHVRRLIHDANKLAMLNASPSVTSQELRSVIKEMAMNTYTDNDTKGRASSDHHVFKMMIARGDSNRGYAPAENANTLLIPSIHEHHLSVGRQLKVGVAHMTLSEQPLLAGVKHLNRLEQVMAKIELAKCEELDDLLLTNTAGIAIELSASNLFYYVDGQWHTPCVEKAGVNGVMRQYILEYMRQEKLSCNVSEVNVSQLVKAQAAFSCNALQKVVPISQLIINHQEITLDIERVKALATKIEHQISQQTEVVE